LTQDNEEVSYATANASHIFSTILTNEILESLFKSKHYSILIVFDKINDIAQMSNNGKRIPP